MDSFPSLARMFDTRTEKNVYLYHRRHLVNALVVALGDCVALGLALLVASLTRLWLLGGISIPEWIVLLVPAWLGAAALGRLLPSWGLGIVEELRRLVLLLTVVFAGTAVVMFLFQEGGETSRLTLTLCFLLSLVTVPGFRSLSKSVLIATRSWGLPAVVYGNTERARRVVSILQEEPGLGYVPFGIFSDSPDADTGSMERATPHLGGLFDSSPVAPMAILATAGLSNREVSDLLEGPLARYRQVLLVPDFSGIPSLWVKSRNLAGTIGLEITSNLLDPFPQILKRCVELALLTASGVVWLPAGAFLAGLIWLEDHGVPFYAQQRIGRDGEPFRVIKFRTMVADAERVLEERLSQDPKLWEEWNQLNKLREDPRITRVGRFLRRFSLDEIPQLVNVFWGEMSLVGPRPLPRYHSEQLTERTRYLREQVRPGITGLWQVSGRADTGNAGYERWDPYYVRNWSIWLDIVILIRTLRAVLKRDGAY